jgi:hypothetical protein
MPESMVEERPDSTTGLDAVRFAAARLIASTVVSTARSLVMETLQQRRPNVYNMELE